MNKNKTKKKVKNTKKSPLFVKSSLKKIESLPLKNFFVISIFISVATIFFVFLIIKRLPPEIPLFYGKPLSEERLGGAEMLVLPAFFSLILTVLNLLFAVFSGSSYIKKVLALVSFALSLFALTTTLKIFFLVGNF